MNKPGMAPTATFFLITPYTVKDAAKVNEIHGNAPELEVKIKTPIVASNIAIP